MISPFIRMRSSSSNSGEGARKVASASGSGSGTSSVSGIDQWNFAQYLAKKAAQKVAWK